MTTTKRASYCRRNWIDAMANAIARETRKAEDDPRKRVEAIVRAMALAFDSPLTGLELGARDEYEALLAPDGGYNRATIRRVASVLNAYLALFGQDGVARAGARAASRVCEENDELLRYLASLEPPDRVAERKAGFVPANLGASFVRKGLGLPLFGRFRPSAPPTAPGLILAYRSAERDGTARLYVTRNGPGAAITYAGLGAELSSAARAMECAIVPADAYEPEAGCDAHDFGRYVVVMARRPSRPRRRPVTTLWDPAEYGFLYYIPDDGLAADRLARFLRDLLSGMFGVPHREAERLAALFSERSP